MLQLAQDICTAAILLRQKSSELNAIRNTLQRMDGLEACCMRLARQETATAQFSVKALDAGQILMQIGEQYSAHENACKAMAGGLFQMNSQSAMPKMPQMPRYAPHPQPSQPWVQRDTRLAWWKQDSTVSPAENARFLPFYFSSEDWIEWLHMLFGDVAENGG